MLKKLIVILCLICVSVFAFSSCYIDEFGSPKFWVEESELRDEVSYAILYIIADKKDDAYEKFKNICSEEAFDSEYERLRGLLEGVHTFSVSTESFDKYTENGVTFQDGVFVMHAENGDFIINASIRSDKDGLAGFTITPCTNDLLPTHE